LQQTGLISIAMKKSISFIVTIFLGYTINGLAQDKKIIYFKSRRILLHLSGAN
jgi:hypothetical protein